ncbi:MAG: S46 family peptidase, partial [Gemmatimonadetes bacterium]|nr:S46 family peptidase [Gemmatimonadota bacterium]NIQ54850.1 S46 family peptidase [Gemmatimonadota bacterium]NIU75049.1 S46 family peptidase [Gammaproteobacteria bacterium]NIX44899.1 S46 family peptidase [Gemmatimonadota bacterium]NIY09136.1 S46 family peptidase [Gemmatimonadota bacterium]
ARAIEGETLRSDDPAVRLAATIWPAFQDFSREYARLGARENELEASLGRARFAIYGTDVPPDGTSSPRIADGRVRSYEY